MNHCSVLAMTLLVSVAMVTGLSLAPGTDPVLLPKGKLHFTIARE